MIKASPGPDITDIIVNEFASGLEASHIEAITRINDWSVSLATRSDEQIDRNEKVELNLSGQYQPLGKAGYKFQFTYEVDALPHDEPSNSQIQLTGMAVTILFPRGSIGCGGYIKPSEENDLEKVFKQVLNNERNRRDVNSLNTASMKSTQ